MTDDAKPHFDAFTTMITLQSSRVYSLVVRIRQRCHAGIPVLNFRSVSGRMPFSMTFSLIVPISNQLLYVIIMNSPCV